MNRQQLLYVENISPSSSEENLITYLEKWAPVLQVYFLREKQCTKRSIAAFVRVANEADLDVLILRNQQNYRGKRLFMVRADQQQFFQADHTVIVRNITAKISEENLYDHFEECGKIAFLQIRTDDFAYIGFEDKSSVKIAMNKNNIPLKGSSLKIQLLTRNIEIMIVNLDTLQARMPDLYRKMILPVEPRQPKAGQQQQSQPQQQQPQQQPQQPGNQQQQQQPARQQQQQPRNQQQQSQPARQQQQSDNQQQQLNQRQQQPQQQQQKQQQQQQRGQAPQQQRQLPQQQPLPERQQQQPQPQRQQMSTIQLLKEKANAFAGKQQQQPPQQQKPPQQAPAAQQQQPKKAQQAVPAAPPPPSVSGVSQASNIDSDSDDSDDDVEIVETTETMEIIDDSDGPEIQIEVDTTLVPPIPSAYQPQPGDIMRPVKASEIPMSPGDVKTERDLRSVWVNNIQPETRRLHLVMYFEQFGNVESCKLGSSKSCYFTRWAKICFTSVEAAQRAAEYFLHPFQGGRYLFVLACQQCIDEDPGKVFVLDYLSRYLVYEDVVKAFKHVGDVFYLVRAMDNTYKVRIFFLNTVDANAALAVKSIGGRPIKVERFVPGMVLKLNTNVVAQLQKEREILDPQKEQRLAKILEIYREDMMERCDPIVNPDGKSESNVAVIYNVHKSTTRDQILELFQSVGKPTFIRRENEMYDETSQRVYVGFPTLSPVLKATELTDNLTLNGNKLFIHVAWTKPRMMKSNTLRFFFNTKDISVQSVYDGLIHFGKIRYVEKEKPRKALVVFDARDVGMKNCKIGKGAFIGPVLIKSKEAFSKEEETEDTKKSPAWYNEQCRELVKEAVRARRRMLRHRTEENVVRYKQARSLKSNFLRQWKRSLAGDLDKIDEYDSLEMSVNLVQAVLDKPLIRSIEEEPYEAPPKVDPQNPESIVIDDDDVVEVSNSSPAKNTQPNQPNEKNQQAQNNSPYRPPPQHQQKQQQGKPQQQQGKQPQQQGKQQQQQGKQQQPGKPQQQKQQGKQQQGKPQQQQQQQQRRGPPQQRQQQQQQQQQRPNRDHNRNPFADNNSTQRNHPYHQQQHPHDQRRSMNPWAEQDYPGPGPWMQQRSLDRFMPDDRFDRFGDQPGGRDMNPFDQFGMQQQLRNFSIQDDINRFQGPMDSDDPPLERGGGWRNPQQHPFNRFSPPRQRSPFGHGFQDERPGDLSFAGRDSPDYPPGIPEEEIDEYIMRKQDAIKRRLEQLEKQLITSVESSRHLDYVDQGYRSRRQGTVYSDNGDVHYVPNPAAVARNRERGGRGGAGSGRGRGRGGGNDQGGRAARPTDRSERFRREREDILMRRKRDPFADVDIVPIIRISEDRSPSPKRNREDAFDTAQFDAAWS